MFFLILSINPSSHSRPHLSLSLVFFVSGADSTLPTHLREKSLGAFKGRYLGCCPVRDYEGYSVVRDAGMFFSVCVCISK